MASVWKVDEDSHATLLALLYCLYGQIQIVLSSNRASGLFFEGLACVMKCFTY